MNPKISVRVAVALGTEWTQPCALPEDHELQVCPGFFFLLNELLARTVLYAPRVLSQERQNPFPSYLVYAGFSPTFATSCTHPRYACSLIHQGRAKNVDAYIRTYAQQGFLPLREAHRHIRFEGKANASNASFLRLYYILGFGAWLQTPGGSGKDLLRISHTVSKAKSGCVALWAVSANTVLAHLSFFCPYAMHCSWVVGTRWYLLLLVFA